MKVRIQKPLQEAFNFGGMDASQQKKDSLLTKQRQEFVKNEALKDADIAKILYKQVGINKISGYKIGHEPKTGYAAFVKDDTSAHSSYVNKITELLEQHNWTRFLKQSFNKDMGVKLKEEWKKYYEKFKPEDENYYIAYMLISPDEGMVLIVGASRSWQTKFNGSSYLTFTGEVVYDTDEEEQTAEEKEATKVKNAAIERFKKILKANYKINLSNHSIHNFEYDQETGRCGAKWEWTWSDRRLTASNEVCNIINKKIINTENRWKKTKSSSEFIDDVCTWEYVSPTQDMVCTLNWDRKQKKGFMKIQQVESDTQYTDKGAVIPKVNRKGHDIEKPKFATQKYFAFKNALEDLMDTFTDAEMKVIESQPNQYQALLDAFKKKWIDA